MADNLNINGVTYPGVEAVTITDEEGNQVAFYPDAVRFKEQALTDLEKEQARNNIGAASKEEIDNYLPKFAGIENVGKIPVVGTDGHFVFIDMPEGGASGDVTGVVDEANNVLLSGDLPDGTYTWVFVHEDGTQSTIGTLEFGDLPRYTNLMDTCEVQLNKRYSGSSGATTIGNGGFLIFIPVVGDGSTQHTLRFRNLKAPINAHTNSTIYLLGSDSLTSLGTVNGAAAFANMTKGMTISDDGTSARVDFIPSATTKRIALSLVVDTSFTPIYDSDIADYIITLDEEI